MVTKSLVAALLAVASTPVTAATLLVGNTEADVENIVLVDTVSGHLREFIPAGAGGLEGPDDLSFGPDGALYVSSGTETTGAILRFDPLSGAPKGTFATAPSLRRPYGHVFAPDGFLYVASFRSDEILRFDGTSGAFVDVFAAGTGIANGLNGPNDLLVGPDGALYVSTQGSVADASGGIEFLFDSQILRYDLGTGEGEVLVEQPEPDAESFGFVSFLGLAEGPDGNLWTTDFANGLRVFDFLTGDLVAQASTNYTGTDPSNNFIGSLAFADGQLFVPGFDLGADNLGSLLGYDPDDLAADFSIVIDGASALQRPIGIVPAAAGTPIPLPAGAWLLIAALAMLGLRRFSAP